MRQGVNIVIETSGFGSMTKGAEREKRPANGPHELLLTEIGRLGGEERVKGAEGALAMFQNALSQLVAENPKAYGADENSTIQKQIVGQMFESVRTPFLARTVAELREKAGYILVFGYWVHRAVFTFIGFGLVAALALPLCIVSLMSTREWGWVPGAIGIAAALGAGGWIFSRIRNK